MDRYNHDSYYDAVIVGGGPAGLTAALYLCRAKYRCLVVEKEKFGGQITITSEVVNYPGVYSTDGEGLTKEMQRQAERFGAEFKKAEIKTFKRNEEFFEVETDSGTIKTLGVVIAAGASPREIGFVGEKDFKGRGVAYCATCDGEFFAGRDIFVIGSGFAACEEALFLTRFANNIKMMIRKDFSCTGSVVEEVKQHEKIEIFYKTTIKEVSGDGFVQRAVFNREGEELVYEAEEGFGVFVFAGYEPASGNFAQLVELNDKGYIVTDSNQKTNVDGIYAAGDICIKQLRQVVTAVSDGAVAATSLEKYLATTYDKYSIPARPYKVKEQPSQPAKTHTAQSAEDGAFIPAEMHDQLKALFGRFESKLLLSYETDSRNISSEVEGFMQELAALSDNIICKKSTVKSDRTLPTIDIYSENGDYRGVSFHGVPGGHEFNSFVVGLYNAAGPGATLAQETIDLISSIDKKVHLDVAVTLSCNNCPDLVMAAERIALLNDNVTLEIYDIAHNEKLKEKYKIMSVPCMIVNDTDVLFGKKNIEEIVAAIK